MLCVTYRAGKRLLIYQPLPEDHFDRLLVLRHNFREHGGFEFLRAAIEFSWESKCMDLRDKGYGVMSITTNGRDFRVDYNKSPEGLFLRALWHFPSEDVPRLLDFALRLLQLFEIRWHKVQTQIDSHDPELCLRSWHV